MTTGFGATYRIQFSADFTFADLTEILPYLDRLGIGAIYASPLFAARKGSTHGYDVVDPHRVNPKIGTLREWRELSRNLKSRNIAWLQDIVPNHMAYDKQNRWLQDVFCLGPHSEYYRFFDIDWDHPDTDLNGKVMAPFLGKPLNECLSAGEVNIVLRNSGLYVKYFEHEFALSYSSLPLILCHLPEEKEFEVTEDQLAGADWAAVEGFVRQFESRWCDEHYRRSIQEVIEQVNASATWIEKILDRQFFRLVHWQESEKRINYRRFFTINGLICLGMEREEVFDDYHRFIAELCREGLIDGLRVDHIDGLLDPGEYLGRLRDKVGERYTVVEKILEWDEPLPPTWPISGTTGYHFLAVLNQVFTDSAAFTDFETVYREIAPGIPSFEDMVFQNKRFVLEERMAGELDNLVRLWVAMGASAGSSDLSREERRLALAVFLSAFPVYRVYPVRLPLNRSGREVLDHAMERAVQEAPELKDAIGDLVDVFRGTGSGDAAEQLNFVKRCQQLSGPLAAKGVEDTSFYTFNRLISHNEVGDTPDVFGIDVPIFHERMAQRLQHEPEAINATATHDTKRGEDARMRINALSHFPEEWIALVKTWPAIADANEREAPTANEAYMIYQALIGAWPDDRPSDEFLNRTCEFVQKALREAKRHSNWSEPDEAYEKQVCGFVRELLDDGDFLKTFLPFAEKIAVAGLGFSLGQVVLKVTAPGIPDIYRGTEYRDLNYVDPDNRRPVDYGRRSQSLGQIDGMESPVDIANTFGADGLKQAVLHRVLKFRREHAELFIDGEYIPLKVTGGEDAGKVLAFARHTGSDWSITAVWLSPVQRLPGQVWTNGDPGNGLRMTLPENAPRKWRDIFSSKIIESRNDAVFLDEIFAILPTSVLTTSP